MLDGAVRSWTRASRGTYNTRADLAAATVDVDNQRFITYGYASANDGGGSTWKRLASAPSPVYAWHVQTANGVWAEMDNPEVYPEQFGATAGAAVDQSTYLNNWLAYSIAKKAICVGRGSFRVDAGMLATGDGLRVIGPGGDSTFTGVAPLIFVTTSANTANHMMRVNGDSPVLENFALAGTGTRAAAGNLGKGLWLGSDYTTVTNAAMTAGSPNLTSTGAFNASTDVGKHVRVAGAGTGGKALLATIASVTNSNTVVLNVNAAVTVSGATCDFGTVYSGAKIRNVSSWSHSIGIEFGAVQKFTCDDCDVNGYHGFQFNNRCSPDSGDGKVYGNTVSADSTAGRCFNILAGGAPRIHNNKGVNCQHYIVVDWSLGTSGGPHIVGNHLENGSGHFLWVTGTGVERVIGLQFKNNWCNSGADIVFDDVVAGWVSRVSIVANEIIGNGTDTILIDIGKSVTWFTIDSNLIDGKSGADDNSVTAGVTGINVRSGATYGVVGMANEIKGCATPVANASNTTTAFLVTTDASNGNVVQTIGVSRELVFDAGSTSNPMRLKSSSANAYLVIATSVGSTTIGNQNGDIILQSQGTTHKVWAQMSGGVNGPLQAGVTTLDRIIAPVISTLTIAGGIVTVTGSHHLINTESNAATDDLDTINGGTAGALLVLQASNDARTVVVKNGTGNILLSGSDFSMDSANDILVLFYSSVPAKWVEISRSNNGA